MANVRFGIIGSGFYGAEYARILTTMDEVTLDSVCGGSGNTARRLALELNCGLVDHPETMIRDRDIDAIIVASPSHLHKEAVLAAARAGKHVFCEKPVSLSYSDIVTMTEACDKSQVRFMAAHIMHFISGIQLVKQLLASGEIGEILVCHVERTGWEPRQNSVSWKKNNATSGGHLFHHIHEVDLVQAFVGQATAVFTVGGNLAHRGEGYGDEDDVLLLTLEFGGKAYATLQYGSGFRWGEHHIKINGTKGAILIDFKRSVVELKKNYQTTSYPLHEYPEENDARILNYKQSDGGVIYGKPDERPPAYWSRLMARELEIFRDTVLSRPIDPQYKTLLDHTSAKSSIRTAEAAMESLRENNRFQIV